MNAKPGFLRRLLAVTAALLVVSCSEQRNADEAESTEERALDAAQEARVGEPVEQGSIVLGLNTSTLMLDDYPEALNRGVIRALVIPGKTTKNGMVDGVKLVSKMK